MSFKRAMERSLLLTAVAAAIFAVPGSAMERSAVRASLMSPSEVQAAAAALVGKPAHVPTWQALDYGPSLGPGLIYPRPDNLGDSAPEKPLGVVTAFVVRARSEWARGVCSLNGDSYSFLGITSTSLTARACPGEGGANEKSSIAQACKSQFAADGFRHPSAADWRGCETVDFQRLLSLVGSQAAASAGIARREYGLPTQITVLSKVVMYSDTTTSLNGLRVREKVARSDAALSATIFFAKAAQGVPHSEELSELRITMKGGHPSASFVWYAQNKGL